MEITAIQRAKPIGKTPTIERQARELDSDVEFILDADTVLESDNYIERTVQELYQAVGIASSFGTVLPQRTKDRRRVESDPEVQRFIAQHPLEHPSRRKTGWIHDFARGCTNLYCEMLYVSRRGRRSNRATLQSFRGLNRVPSTSQGHASSRRDGGPRHVGP